MPGKKKVKWYDTFNPFAHIEAKKPAKKKAIKKSTSPDFEAAVKSRPPLSPGEKRKKPVYQGTPTDPSRDKKRTIKVVKPKKRY